MSGSGISTLSVSAAQPPDAAAPRPAALDAETAQAEAVAAASVAPQVVVTTLDASGRPSFTALPAAEAPAWAGALAEAPGGEVVSVDPVEPVNLPAPTPSFDAAGAAAAPVRPAATNDPNRPGQWAVSQYDIERAWSCGRGTAVNVAVIDTGVDATHPEFAGRIVAGTSFVPGEPATTDPNGHGTHVAGIIAAAADNGIGVVGVAPEARIMPIKVLDRTGSGTTLSVAQGIVWAADNGARVINLSLGGPGEVGGVQGLAVAYAVAKGAVVVAAAGNAGPGSPAMMPGAHPDAICVGAIGSDGLIAPFSTTGPQVDLAAPGRSILSTWPAGGYATLSGTSMATPEVAGLAALLVGTHPTASVSWIRNRIESTAVDAGVPGRDHEYGLGRWNPTAAVGAPID